MLGAGATLREALWTMRDRGISSVLVVPQPGSAEHGILTMRDIIAKVVSPGLDPVRVRVGDLVSWRLTTADPAWSLQQAAATMARAKVRRLPVASGDDIVGIVSDTDLFTSLVPHDGWEHARDVRKERALRRVHENGMVKTVADLMSSPVISIDAGALVIDAARKMGSSGVSSLIVQKGDDVVGIVTKRGIVTKVMAEGKTPEDVAVADVMSAPVRTIDAGATIEACSARMVKESVRRFPVTSEGRIVGIISDKDILSAVAAERWRARRRVPGSFIVADVMRPPVGTMEVSDGLLPEMNLWDAADRIAAAATHQLPVVQAGKVIGTVGEADILRALEERGAGD
jgi:signal-transduction protein with cAMP-binding, CBS, and nucleotidyltransferase domain